MLSDFCIFPEALQSRTVFGNRCYLTQQSFTSDKKKSEMKFSGHYDGFVRLRY